MPSAVAALDSLLVRLAAARDGLVVPLARAAGAFVGRSAWFDCGFARSGDFARERLGRSGRWLHDLAALDDRFRCFPSLAGAVSGSDGGPPLGRVAALVVGRVAGAGDIEAWIARARRVSVRELRQIVRSGSDWVSVSIELPGPIRVAFEEVLSLHRAAVGREVGVADFVEALVGEVTTAVSAVEPVADVEPAAVHRVAPVSHGAVSSASSAVRAALDLLSRLEEAEKAVAHDTSLPGLVQALESLVHIEDEIEVHLGELLAELGDLGAWSSLGYSGAAEYGQERLRLSRTVAWRRQALSRSLRRLREVQAAYRTGDLGFEAAQGVVRILGRSATPAQQRTWIEHARRVTIKRLRDEEGLALHQRLLEAKLPQPADDATWLGSLHRQPGRSLDRVLGLGCLVLGHWVQGERDFDVFLRLRLPEDVAVAFRNTLEHVRSLLAEKGPPASPALPSQRIAWHLRERGKGVPAWVGLLAMLEEYACTWDQGIRRRAEKTYEQAGYRCMAPGCTSRNHLERHHIGYRSHIGGNEPENLVCLCRMHHQEGEHQGRAALRGRAPLHIRWRLGRSQVATWYWNERKINKPGP